MTDGSFLAASTILYYSIYLLFHIDFCVIITQKLTSLEVRRPIPLIYDLDCLTDKNNPFGFIGPQKINSQSFFRVICLR